MHIKSAVVSDVGLVRKVNQDNYFLNHYTKAANDRYGAVEKEFSGDGLTFSVCDGLGGEDFGEVAASIAVEKLKSFEGGLFYENWQDYIDQANQSICEYANKNNCTMGTTFTCVSFHKDKALWINVGDSRIYRLREGKLEQLSLDHTEFQFMVDTGQLKQEDYHHSKTRNRLTQHLGIDPEEMELEPHIMLDNQVQAGDCYLLCSDGVCGSLSDEEMMRIMNGQESLLSRCKTLVEHAFAAGSKDNATAMLISVEELVPTVLLSSKETSDKINKVTETKSNQAGIIAKILVPVLILAIIFAGVGIYFHNYPKVPSVIGMQSEEAQTLLDSKGFQVEVKYDYSNEYQDDQVMKQSLYADKRVKRGSKISLTVCEELEVVTLPDLTGVALEEAQVMLEDMGMEVDITEVSSGDMAPGCVVSQTPDAGSEVLSGNIIKLFVAK